MKDVAFTKVLSWGTIQKEAKGFIERGGKGEIDIEKATSDLLPLARILMGIGVITLLITGMIMGVKYMLSGADEQAKMKEKLVWYVVAAAFIFGSVGIYNVVVGVLNSLNL